MKRITDPEMIDHPELRDMSLTAAWVAQLEEAMAELENAQEYFDALEQDVPEVGVKESFGVTPRDWSEDDADEPRWNSRTSSSPSATKVPTALLSQT